LHRDGRFSKPGYSGIEWAWGLLDLEATLGSKDSTVRSSPIEPAARTIEARILQKLQPPRRQLSDIDRYFEDGVVTAQDPAMQDKEWLSSWWRAHCHEYPRVGAAARDYLAIPASEVAVERLFNSGRD
jgi:hypothetical protein